MAVAGVTVMVVDIVKMVTDGGGGGNDCGVSSKEDG